MTKKILFASGYEGYHTYRIPSLLVTKKDTVLAVCEGRKVKGNDTGEIHLLIRRSVDSGETFLPLEIIWKDNKNTCGNPCLVQDGLTGRINLLCCWNDGRDTEHNLLERTGIDTRRIYLIHSDDEGKTWSIPQEITKDVKRDGWSWYATGPGNGIQMTETGRLIVPCNHSQLIESTGKSGYYSHIIYSDDGGILWKHGGSVSGDGTNECQVVELSDGSLMINMRVQEKRGTRFTRQTAISHDGGITWQNQKYDNALIEPVCQASIIRANNDKKPYWLFCNPANKDYRYNATVRISYDDCKTWEYDRCIYPAMAAYSSLSMLNNGEVLCFLECGMTSSSEKLVLFRFNEDWIKRKDKENEFEDN